jgi:hypothetical protein
MLLVHLKPMPVLALFEMETCRPCRKQRDNLNTALMEIWTSDKQKARSIIGNNDGGQKPSGNSQYLRLREKTAIRKHQLGNQKPSAGALWLGYPI